MAKSRAKAFVQRRVSVIQVASLCRRASPSAMHRSSGSPIPREAKMIWKASDVPIWARAANRSDITKSPSPFVLPELEASCPQRYEQRWQDERRWYVPELLISKFGNAFSSAPPLRAGEHARVICPVLCRLRATYDCDRHRYHSAG